MVDIMDVYKVLNISTVTVMKNTEIFKFVPNHLKTKKMYKHAVKKLPYLLRYVSDQYKTQQMRDRAILKNGGTLISLFLTATEINKCVIKLLRITLMHWNLFLNPIRLKTCVIKYLLTAFLYLILFLINIKIKKCMTLLFLMILL